MTVVMITYCECLFVCFVLNDFCYHLLTFNQNKTNSTNLYPPTKGYLRETCKSQNINPIYLSLSSPSVSFRSYVCLVLNDASTLVGH